MTFVFLFTIEKTIKQQYKISYHLNVIFPKHESIDIPAGTLLSLLAIQFEKSVNKNINMNI